MSRRNVWRICEVIFDLDRKKARVEEIEKIEAAPGLWEDPEQAKEILREKGNLLRFIDAWEVLATELEEIEILLEIAEVENEGEAEEAQKRLHETEDGFRTLELEKMFTEDEDRRNAIVNVNAGAGGTEAQDWAEMLLRMYLRWAERRGFATEIVDILAGEQLAHVHIRRAVFVAIVGIDHLLGTPAVVAPYVTDGHAPQIRLPQKAAQHVPSAIADSNGAQYYSFAGGHTAILA